MLTLLAALVSSQIPGGSSVPVVLVTDGRDCGAGLPQMLVIDVRRAAGGGGGVEFHASVFAGAMDTKGVVVLGDSSRMSFSGRGSLRLELPGMTTQEKQLRSIGWHIFRSVEVEVDGKLIVVAGVETDRPSGQCMVVRI